jgi:hypothetical protein
MLGSSCQDFPEFYPEARFKENSGEEKHSSFFV